MKPAWIIKRLGDLCSFENGDRGVNYPSRSAQTVQGIPFINAGHLTEAGIDTERLNYIPEEHFERLGSGKIRTGDILFCLRGSLGKCSGIQPLSQGAIASSLVIVRPRETVLNAFVLAYFRSHLCAEMIARFKNGAAQPNLSAQSLSNFVVPFPPLAEQQRIVRILDEAFDRIATAKANAEKNHQNARAVFDGYLRDVFEHSGQGWAVKRVGDIAYHTLGKMLDQSKNKGEPQPYLRNINVRWFTFDLSDVLEMRFLPEEESRYTAVHGDVLVCEGGYPGRAAIWNEDYPIYFQKALHRLRFQCSGHNRWFVYYLYSKDKDGELRRYFTGTGIQHFTREALNRLEIPIPPPSELKELLSRSSDLSIQTRRLESLYQRKLAALEELKKSLLHQAFAGAL